jgi:hypothetical protein
VELPVHGSGSAFRNVVEREQWPEVHEPGRRGFGSTVLEDVIKGQFEANVALDYPATGVVWRIECPAGAV